MKTFENKTALICNIFSALLLLVLVGIQFFPFWEVEVDGVAKSVSFAEFLWFPKHNTEITTMLKAAVKDFAMELNTFPLLPALVYACAIINLGMLLRKAKNFMVAFCGFVAGMVLSYSICSTAQSSQPSPAPCSASPSRW